MASTSLWFGVLNQPILKRRPLSSQTWTCLGALAIPLWATWPALALRALEMPAFECLTIAFFFAWAVLAFFRKSRRRGHQLEATNMDTSNSLRGWPVRLECLSYFGNSLHPSR
jgi:hypothetical protein